MRAAKRATRTIYDVLHQKIEDMENLDVLVVINCERLGIETFFQLLEKMKNKDPKFEKTFYEHCKRQIRARCRKELGIDLENIDFKQKFILRLGLKTAVDALPVFPN